MKEKAAPVGVPSGKTKREPIAIIGMGCRFPGGADDPERFWHLMWNGVDPIGEVPPDRWDIRLYANAVAAEPGADTRKGGFVHGLERFDAQFFGISPREASRMDPQQRLLLQVAWEAFEDAGIVPETLAGSDTGVFVGVSNADYLEMQYSDPTSINAYTSTGGLLSLVPNRLSYAFDFHGPSLAVDTACSSALVAVHLACQSLWNGEASLALAGGANVLLRPAPFIGFGKASLLSPSGRCRSFDAQADGYVRAEGAGVILLKPLSRALADGDPVQAVIVATGVNSDGWTTGISQPNGRAQEALLQRVYRDAGIDPQSVCYVEAHGTGTAVGDPVEALALGRVLGQGRGAENVLRIGSVKSNIGHLESASGIAGLIKVVLSLRHRALPGNLHFHEPNPSIPFEQLGLRVQAQSAPLPSHGRSLVMGVNSFGVGGTNAHVVVQEFQHKPLSPRRQEDTASERTELLVLSARDPESLKNLATSLADRLLHKNPPPLADICYTAAVRRSHHRHRLAVVASDFGSLAEQLKAYAAGQRAPALAAGQKRGEAPALVFVFSGNGGQWPGMGVELMDEEPVFRRKIEQVDDMFRARAGWSVAQELLNSRHAPERLEQAEIALPALFAVQVGLLELWRSWGIRAQAVIGHSIGEIAAAYAAGALDLGQAVHVIYERSRLQQCAPPGRMAAAALGPDAARAAIEPYGRQLSLAAVNSPGSVTLSGEAKALEDLGRTLQMQGVFFRLLPLGYAFHSPAMDPVRQPLIQALGTLQPSPATLRFVSTVTGEDVKGPELNAAYWWHNVRRPVQFAAAMDRLIAEGFQTFLEIGPHPILGYYITECLRAQGQTGHALASLVRGETARASLLYNLGRCYTLGMPWQPEKLFPQGGRLVSLPRYPWRNEPHWHQPSPDFGLPRGLPEHPLLGTRLPGPEPVWQNRVDLRSLPFLADHVVQDKAIVPASAYIETGLAAAGLSLGDGPCELRDLAIRHALRVEDEPPVEVQVLFAPDKGRLRIVSRQVGNGSEWVENASCRLRLPANRAAPSPKSLEAIRLRCPVDVSPEEHYRAARQQGLHYGAAFQAVEHIRVGDQEALALLRLPRAATVPGVKNYRAHPVLLDACLQAALPLIAGDARALEDHAPYIPVRIERIRFYAPLSSEVYGHVSLFAKSKGMAVIDASVLAEDGQVLMEVKGCRLQKVMSRRSQSNPFYRFAWEPAPPKALPETVGAVRQNTPGPLFLAQQVAPKMSQLSLSLGRPAYYHSVQPQMDALCAAYALRALRSLTGGAPVRPASLVEGGTLAPQHMRLTLRLLERLEEEGLARRDQTGWILGCQASDLPETLWRSLAGRFPDYHAEWTLAARCGNRLAEVLRGEYDPLALLFGDKTLSTIEHLYDSAPRMRVYNLALQEIVRELTENWPKGHPLRVLEIGAGTGGTTAFIVPLLSALKASYVVSDISETFLSRAQGRFSIFPHVTTARVDIELSPEENGLEPHSMDVIIAANVLHATENLRQTLKNVTRLLAPGGLLLMAESRRDHWLDLLIFGLLPGWWRFSDGDLRKGSPLVDADRWISLLREQDYQEALVLADAEEGFQTQQAVVLAQAKDRPASSPSPGIREKGRAWLFLVDGVQGSPWQLKIVHELRRFLTHRGHDVVIASRASEFAQEAPDRYKLRPDSSDDVKRLLQSLLEGGLACQEIVHLWGTAPGETARDPMPDGGCLDLVTFVQGLVQSRHQPPRLWVVTGGVHAPPQGKGASDPSQAPLWGLGRVLMSEHPELKVRLVDLVPNLPPLEAARCLAAEMLDPDPEDEILLSSATRYVHRLRRVVPEDFKTPGDLALASTQASFRLALDERGSLDALRWRTAPRRPPGPGELEIVNRAAGLNFRDVMWATGLLEPEAVEGGFAGSTLGMECAGEVVAVGSGVSDFRVGDAVMGFAPSALGRFVTVPAQWVIRKPEHLTWEAAATVPVAFLTAYYALGHVARLQKGERVLIHAAAGGVGLAAVQIARSLGAEVFATAGTPEKREYLHEIGIAHVMDSRSLSFVEEVMDATGGQGVDVVLNSLSGPAVAEGLHVLGPFGRFLEIGKRDIYQDTMIGLSPFRRSLSYFAIDVDRLLKDRPALAGRLYREVMAQIEAKAFHALPYRVFPASRASEAFRYMQQSKHTGKVVLSLDDPLVRPIPAPSDALQTLRVDPDATYLITGGLGGLGLATARWLAEKGARNLVLISRRGASDDKTRAEVETLKEAGVRVLPAAVDVARRDQLESLLAQVRAEFPPLRGIFHAAMVLDDGIVLHLDRQRLRRVIEPKAVGAWNLHLLTLNDPLDWFVCFSSASTVVGNPGQGNYSAANAFLEALAAYRRTLGRPALTVSWGAISEVGYLARNEEVRTLLAQRTGLSAMAPRQALSALERLLMAGNNEMIVADIDWRQWRQGVGMSPSPKYAHAATWENSQGHDVLEKADARSLLARLGPRERRGWLMSRIAGHIGAILGLAGSELDPLTPLVDLGFDSLASVELQEAIRSDTAVEVPMMHILQGGSIEALAEFISRRLGGESGEPGRTDNQDPHVDVPPPRSVNGRLVVRLAPRPLPAMRLVAIPYLAGAASAFRAWPAELPPTVEVLALNLPGRPGRPQEEPYRNMQALVRDVLEELVPALDDRPFAIYGHSLGALIAYELAWRLQADHGLIPYHVIVAAYHAPDLPPDVAPLAGSRPDEAAAHLSDAALAERLRPWLPSALFQNAAVLRRLLPAIRAEVQMVSSYVFSGGGPLRCPLTCIGGAEDELMVPELLADWRRHTDGPFRHITVPGGHLFLRSHRQELLTAVKHALGFETGNSARFETAHNKKA